MDTQRSPRISLQAVAEDQPERPACSLLSRSTSSVVGLIGRFRGTLCWPQMCEAPRKSWTRDSLFAVTGECLRCTVHVATPPKRARFGGAPQGTPWGDQSGGPARSAVQGPGLAPWVVRASRTFASTGEQPSAPGRHTFKVKRSCLLISCQEFSDLGLTKSHALPCSNVPLIENTSSCSNECDP